MCPATESGSSPCGFVLETTSVQETEAFGARLAERLHGGDLVLLRGEVGSGKTALVRGVARALGVSDPLTSPTFSIGHRYQGRSVRVSHLDLYRIGTLGLEDPALIEDYLGEGDITFVEWPPDDEGDLAQARLRIDLAHRGGDRRRIAVSGQ